MNNFKGIRFREGEGGVGEELGKDREEKRVNGGMKLEE